MGWKKFLAMCVAIRAVRSVLWVVSRQPVEVAVADLGRAGSDTASTNGGAVAVDRDEAVGALFRRHYRDLVGLAFCLLGDRGAAEEVVQDAFVALHRHWWGLREQPCALAYLRATVVNGSRSRQRRLVRARAAMPGLTPVMTSRVSPEDTAVSRDEAARLADAVRTLPTRQREVLVCLFYLELTETQTANLLLIGRTSVKTHAHRALAGLTRRLAVTR